MKKLLLISLIGLNAGCRTYHKIVGDQTHQEYHGAAQPALPTAPSVSNAKVATYSGGIPYVAYVVLPEGGQPSSYVVVYVFENGQWIQVPEFSNRAVLSYVYDRTSGLGSVVRFKYTTNDIDMYCIYLITPQ